MPLRLPLKQHTTNCQGYNDRMETGGWSVEIIVNSNGRDHQEDNGES